MDRVNDGFRGLLREADPEELKKEFHLARQDFRMLLNRVRLLTRHGEIDEENCRRDLLRTYEEMSKDVDMMECVFKRLM